jgi:hypothetical protein
MLALLFVFVAGAFLLWLPRPWLDAGEEEEEC